MPLHWGVNVLTVSLQLSIQALHARGWSRRRIARELGVHRETVAGYIAEPKLPISTAGSEPGLESKAAISTVPSDQYGAYASHERKTEGIVRGGCWAHARRKVNDAVQERPKAANLVLRVISRLYRLERAWDEARVGELRAELRREHFARPRRWLRYLATALGKQGLPQSQLGKACSYLLNHWDVLFAHQQHSFTRLDNNLVENAIRPSAIGKRNWFFIGHPGAGQRSAIIYSLVVSCQRHGKDPLAYLRDVLRRLPAMSNHDALTPLTPAARQPA